MADTYKSHTYWLNGIVKVNGIDLATIEEVDGPVEYLHSTPLAEHAGSRPHVVEVHSVGGRITVKLTASSYRMQQLRVLLGYTQGVGVLDDGITNAAKFTVDNHCDFGKRQVIELLIQGTKSMTCKKVEIKATRAVLINDYSWMLSKEELAKPELEFLIIGDPDDRDADVISIYDEDEGS